MVEQVAAEATLPPPQRTDRAPGSFEDRPAPMDTEAMPLSPPPPLLFFLSRKRPVDELPLAPLKALKVSPGSSTHWVAEAQAAIQCSAVSAKADPKEPAAQGGAAEVTPTQMREGVLPPCEGEAHESNGAGVPLVTEAFGVSEAKATEARAPKTTETAMAAVGVSTSTEATVAEAGAPETVEAIIAEAGAPKITKAIVMGARPSVQEAEMKAAEASVAPLVQGPPLLRESAREAEVEAYHLKEEAEALRWKEKAKAYWVETRRWELKAKESEVEVTRAAEASSAVQTVLKTEIGEHEALKRAVLSAYEALEVEGVQSGSSLGSRLIALSSQMCERL
ncbi:uncharacterized protein [Miscanthus floridulus]|uniref:uncharacterized protein n=1 Tax=Miscanthus floridulus TaxID=154761 RepID=UPI0034574026